MCPKVPKVGDSFKIKMKELISFGNAPRGIGRYVRYIDWHFYGRQQYSECCSLVYFA